MHACGQVYLFIIKIINFMFGARRFFSQELMFGASYLCGEQRKIVYERRSRAGEFIVKIVFALRPYLSQLKKFDCIL